MSSHRPLVRIESQCVTDDGQLQVAQNKVTIDGVDISGCVTEVYIQITETKLPKVSLTVIPARLDIQSLMIDEIRNHLIEENRS